MAMHSLAVTVNHESDAPEQMLIACSLLAPESCPWRAVLVGRSRLDHGREVLTVIPTRVGILQDEPKTTLVQYIMHTSFYER